MPGGLAGSLGDLMPTRETGGTHDMIGPQAGMAPDGGKEDPLSDLLADVVVFIPK